MPVDHDRLDDLAAAVVDIYAEAELALLRIIADRLIRDLDAPDWATRRLADIRALLRAAGAVVARLDRQAEPAVRDLIAGAYSAGNASALADLAGTLMPEQETAIRAATDAGAGSIHALADATIGELRPVHRAILPAVGSVYRRAVAGATARVLAGVQDKRKAAQAAWAALVDRGITSFTDVTGREWKLHTYVEMAVRTAATRAAVHALADGYTLAGQRLVYVTDRPGECYLCRPWEHKVLALWGEAGPQTVPSVRGSGLGTVDVDVAGTLAEAMAAGLFHPQCRHGIGPWLAGRTRLKRATEDPEGDAARQRQRYIERQLRKWRRREAAALIDEAQQRAAGRVAAWGAEMARHIAATGMLRLRYREVPGAGHEATEKTDRADLPVR